MNLALVAIVLAIGAGAVVAVSARDAAAVAIGLAMALVAAGLLAEPLPSAAILGVRIVAALLAVALIRWAARGGQRQFSPLGWPAEAMLATAAAVAGLGMAVGLASIGTPIGPDGGAQAASLTTTALILAAGTSLLALGAAPLVHGRPGVRRAIGLVLVTQAVLLVRVGLAGPATELEEITRAGLLVAAAASGSALARAAAIAFAGRAETADDADGAADRDGPAAPGPPGARRVASARGATTAPPAADMAGPGQ
jgi:hypothetical protein